MVTVCICSKLKVLFKNNVGKNSPYFVGVFNKTNSTHACWIWDDYSQLGAMRLIGYLPSHNLAGSEERRLYLQAIDAHSLPSSCSWGSGWRIWQSDIALNMTSTEKMKRKLFNIQHEKKSQIIFLVICWTYILTYPRAQIWPLQIYHHCHRWLHHFHYLEIRNS